MISITAVMATARAAYADGTTEPFTSKIPMVPRAIAIRASVARRARGRYGVDGGGGT